MNEFVGQLWADLQVLARSLSFWGWHAVSILVAYLLAITIARARYSSTSNATGSAAEGLVLGSLVSGVGTGLALYYLWTDSYAVLIVPPVVLMLVVGVVFLVVRPGSAGSRR